MKRFEYHCSEAEFWRALRYAAARNDYKLTEKKNGFSITWQWRPDYRGIICDKGKMRFYGKIMEEQGIVSVSMRLRSPLWVYFGVAAVFTLPGIVSKSLFGFFAGAVFCTLYLTGGYFLEKRIFRRRNQKIIEIFSSLEDVMQEGNSQNA